MFTQKAVITTLVTLFVSVITVSTSLAQDTLLISYQGRLTDDGGDPVTGTPSMTFTIYDGSGDPKWTESHPSVLVDNGLFNVILGSQTTLPDSVFTGDDRYLGITVSGDPEIFPRTLFTSAPSAAYAKRVAGDIVTAPGTLVIHSDQGDSALVLSANDMANAMTINWGIPPGIRPGIVMQSGPDSNAITLNWGVPPGIRPVAELNAGSSKANFTFNWSIPPGIMPAFQIQSDDELEKVSLGLSVPPGIIPALEFIAEAGSGASMMIWDENGKVMGIEPSPFNTGHSIKLFDPTQTNETAIVEISSDYGSGAYGKVNIGFAAPPDDIKAGVELTSEPSAGKIRIGGSDPGMGGDPTAIVLTAGATSVTVGIGTENPMYTLDVRGTIGNNTTLYHSDKRWKRDIQKLEGSLNRVMKLQGVQYKWKQEEYPEMNFPNGQQIGLIAQDVEKIIPEVVNESADGYKSLDYAKLVSILVESIKEQQDQIETLSERIEELEGMKISSR